MKKNLLIFLALISSLSSLLGQKKDSLWTTSIGGSITSMELAMDGTLMAGYVVTNVTDLKGYASTTDLNGIDPTTGKIKWNYHQSSPFGWEPVRNTPFYLLKNQPLKFLDPSDGRIVFDLSKTGIEKIESYGFLLQSGHLWINGIINGDRAISVFSLANGAMLWSNSDFLKQKNKAASKLAKFSALAGAGAPPSTMAINLLSPPINHGTDAIILATSNGLFHVQVNTGKVDWQAELPDPNKGKMVKTEVGNGELKLILGRDDNFYVSAATYFTACNYSDGNQLWSKPVKTSGVINSIAYDEKGLILFPGTSNAKGLLSHNFIKMVNEKTGESLWGGDGLKFNGVVKHSIYSDKGLAVVIESESDKNQVNFIDVAAGKFVLPKNINLNGHVEYVEVIPKGLFYRTDRTANILDIASDKPLLKMPIAPKDARTILTANSSDRFYFYNYDDDNVYEINKADGTGRQLNKAKLAFKGGEIPARAEVRTGGVVLYSAHNATLVTSTGDAKYNIYNRTPHKIDEILNITSAALGDFSDVIDMDEVYSKGKNIGNVAIGTGGDANANRNQYNQINQAYATAGTAAYIRGLKQFGAIKDRVLTSRQSTPRIYMMTKVDGRTTIITISKDDGSTVFTLPLAKNDDEPRYCTDEILGQVYYNPRGASLIGWPKGAQNDIAAYKIQVP